MDELLARISEAVTGRIEGPMAFRLVLQPAVAMFLAIRAGLHDARTGQPYYAWEIFTDPVHRHELLREGWKAVAKVFVLAVLIDLAYQLMVVHTLHPLVALFVAFLLACVPYLLVRGPVNRLMRTRRQPKAA